MTDEMNRKDYSAAFSDRLKQWQNAETIQKAQEWLRKFGGRLDTMLENVQVRDFIFEPIKGVFYPPGDGQVLKARTVITQVAVVNAVIAGLPGSLGVGVYVAIALELWMAFALSRVVGLSLSREEVTSTLTSWAIGLGGVFIVFKQMLNLVFPVVTAVMPFAGFGTAITQLIVTNIFGVMLWVMFEEFKSGRKFSFPATSIARLGTETKALLLHQKDAGVGALSYDKWRSIGERLLMWFRGDIVADIPRLKGELVSTVVMAWLLNGHYDRLTGPLAQEFVGAIRDRFPELSEATLPEIASHMSSYDADQIIGVINLIKGKVFERMVVDAENSNGDVWTAHLHEDESFPGSDMILENNEGEMIEISLKASSSRGYLEDALDKYPEIPIMTTDEVAGVLAHNPLVSAAGISNEELTSVTATNFDNLVSQLQPIDAVGVVATGATAGLLVTLWPFTVAFMRGRIDKEQLQSVVMAVLPETGGVLAARLAYAVALGPVFAWWLLARGVMKVSEPDDAQERSVVGRLSLK
jgi:uncharacterized protein (DUF697 family)